MKKVFITSCVVLAGAATLALTVNKNIDSVVFRSNKDDVRTAIELWPTTKRLPMQHALAEVVWYRKAWKQGSYERFNISAMTDSEPMYRFGVERGNGVNDRHHEMRFCFERPESEIGLPADCSFRVHPELGPLVCDNEQRCWSLLDALVRLGVAPVGRIP